MYNVQIYCKYWKWKRGHIVIFKKNLRIFIAYTTEYVSYARTENEINADQCTLTIGWQYRKCRKIAVKTILTMYHMLSHFGSLKLLN